MDKATVALCPSESVTFAVKGYEPMSDVVPVIAPVVDCNWIPDGNDPLTRLHWYGVTPPVAESDAV
jgi:hypothetical protein